jgi:prepilin-type N-terminal cleavage/methylation domain-containing protein
MKKGFGLLEVLIAAVVLGFLIVGLNKLQMGNREVILRVRARDAANFVAQNVLDSLGSSGINSIQAKKQPECDNNILVYCEPKYTYYFEGKPQLDKSSAGIKTTIDYKVEVELLTDSEQKAIESTNFEPSPSPNIYAKSLQATVKWKFKDSEQSIQAAKVVR